MLVKRVALPFNAVRQFPNASKSNDMEFNFSTANLGKESNELLAEIRSIILYFIQACVTGKNLGGASSGKTEVVKGATEVVRFARSATTDVHK